MSGWFYLFLSLTVCSSVNWLDNFSWWSLSWWFITYMSPSFYNKVKHWNWLNALDFVVKLFSSSVLALAASAHREFLKETRKFPLFNMAHTLLYVVANLCSTLPFCCSKTGMVYLIFLLIPFCSHSLSNTLYSPALLQYLAWSLNLY